MNEIKAGVLLSLKDKFSQGIKDAGGTVQKFASSAASAIQGIDKAFSGLGTAAGALGVSLSVGAATKEIIQLDDSINAMGMQAGVSAESVNELKQTLFDVASAKNVKLPIEQLRIAAETLIAQTGDLQYVKDNMMNIGLAIRATGAAGADMGMLYAVFNTMGLTVEETAAAFGTLVEQGKMSGFIMKDMSAIGPRLIAQYRAFGRDGVAGVKEAGAALEYIYKGIQNADITGTAFASLLASFQDLNVMEKLQVGLGVKVTDDEGNMRAVTDLIKETVEAAKGDSKILSQLFNQQSMKALNSAIAEYKFNLEHTGVGAVTGIQEFLEMTGDANSVLADAAVRSKSLASNIQEVQTAFVKFVNSEPIGVLEKINELLNYLSEDPKRFSKVFTGIAVGIGSIAAVKGLASVMNVISSIVLLKKGGGNINIGSNVGGLGMPVYVTNWGGKAGASPLPSAGAAGNQPIGKTPTGQPAGTPLNAGSQGNTFQKMGGAASQAVKGLSGKQLAAGGAAAGIGAALVAIPNAIDEVSQINADETLTKKEKSTAKGGAIGDAAGTVVGATAGGIAGGAAGAAVGAAVGSVVPVLGTAVGALVGAGIGALGGWLGGKAGRAIGEGIGSAVAGDDEQLSETLTAQLPEITIPSDMLPPEITNNYMTGSPQYTGATAELSGTADVNLNLTLTDTRTMFTAETSRNTARNIRVKTGSAVEAREML